LKIGLISSDDVTKISAKIFLTQPVT
jgi:hypothetical protein